MICISKQLSISNGTAPYTYTWLTNNPCVKFNKLTGTSPNGIIMTNICFSDEDCLTNSVIQLHVKDSVNCEKTFAISKTNPCTEFAIEPIVLETNDMVFSYTAVASNGNPPFTYDWIYDTSVFQLNKQLGNRLDLNLVNPMFNETTNVTVIMTDANGCTRLQTYSYTFCQAIANNITYQGCIENNLVTLNGRLISLSLCNSVSIDWSTLQFSLPTGVTITPTGYTSTQAVLNISVHTNVNSDTTIEIPWTVRDVYGI